MTSAELNLWINDTLSLLSMEFDIPTHRMEALLDFHGWDIDKIRSLCRSDMSGAFKKASMAELINRKGSLEPLCAYRSMDLECLVSLANKTDKDTEGASICDICQETMSSPVSPKDFIDNEEAVLRAVQCSAGKNITF